MNKNKGSVLVLSFMISIAFGIAVMGFYKVLNARTKQGVYYSAKKGGYELAVMGLNAAMGQLIRASKVEDFNNTAQNWTEVRALHGKYKNNAAIVPANENGGKPVNYYIKTDAEITKGSTYVSTTLHSYVQLSNIGEYFAAIKGSLSVSPGINAAGGRIYADNLTFAIPDAGDPPTRIRGAEYNTTVFPPVTEGNPNIFSDNVWPGVDPTRVIVNPANPAAFGFTVNDGSEPYGMPRNVKAPLVFPQVLDSDIQTYCDEAPDGNQCGGANNVLSIENNPLINSAPNASTIICCNFNNGTSTKGLIRVGNITVQGQVLFVSNGNIEITGNILKGGSISPPQVANQAILLAQGDVYINNIVPKPTIPQTHAIAAMIVAPNGALIPRAYVHDPADPNPHPHTLLSLNFTGSWILSRVSIQPDSFPNVYQVGRQYNYDDTLRTDPPPQLPVISKVWFSFEEAGNSTGFFK